ncbi:MAG: penicillin-binding protein 1C [Ardenticatenia bacterium]|nr:penicillin-binding protein 1C [Ardenticatenia bacterium]
MIVSRIVVRLACVGLLGITLAGVSLWWWALRDLPDPRTVADGLPTPSARIYDRRGNLLYEVILPGGGKHVRVSLERIPLALRRATLATEDAAFYQHPGVDWRGILRALRANVRAGRLVAGGSTITQQVARNLLLPPDERRERTWRRKVRESVLALWLERTFSKDELLALYLNTTYYGNFAYGVEAAAQAYFGKHVWELDVAESALLAGLPQAPAEYNPLLNPEAALERRRQVVRLMVNNGFLTPEEGRRVAEAPLDLAATPFPIEAPHFVMYVLGELEARYGATAPVEGGWRITTTLDVAVQDVAEAAVRRHLTRLREGFDRRVRNAAVVVMDPTTGEVLAMVGSPDYFDSSVDGAVNAAVMPRQPGSAIKPITYATAFDPARAPNGRPLSPATVLADVPTTFVTRQGTLYRPQNFDRKHVGPISLRTALATSNNVIAVKVLKYVGVEAMVRTARDMGIRSLTDPERYDLTVTLGGGEVTLLELTAAYATLASGGIYRPPVTIVEITDAEGRVILRRRPDRGQRVLDPRVAFLVTDVLADPYARASVFGLYSPLRLDRPAAVKTGTTTDFRDNWTLGYTPDLVVGVWVGNANGEPMRGVSGLDGAAPIWRDVMLNVLRHRPPLPFTPPEGLVRVTVCAASGLLPTPLCPEQRVEWFVAGYEPRRHDASYVTVNVDTATGLLAAPSCTGPVERRVYRVPPPEALRWAQEHGWSLPPTRSCARTSSRPVASTVDVRITSPVNGTRFKIDPNVPRTTQRLAILLDASRPVEGVEGLLVLDGVLLSRFTSLPFEFFWPLQPGDHMLVARLRVGGEEVTTPPVRFTVEP